MSAEAGSRCLIVNADDLGLSPAVNEGIFVAHERGIVTSATLMVRQAAAPAATVAAALADELGVPLRGHEVRYEGGFYGQGGRGEKDPEGIEGASLTVLIEALPTGWTEVGCHPAAGPVPSSSYDAERVVELRTLCDPRVRQALTDSGFVLRSFVDLG